MIELTLSKSQTKPTRCIYTLDSVPVNITGWTFKIFIKYKPTVLEKVATITGAVQGLYEFQWVVGDLKVGQWEAELVVIDALGKDAAVPFVLTVNNRIGI